MQNHLRQRGFFRRGFTLVELLVVIGIIALLVGILLPTLNRARRAGQVAVCLSNIRQLSVAVQNYITENKGLLPEAVYNNKTSLLSPKGTGQDAWQPFNHPRLGQTYTLPSIGEALRPYLGRSEKIWQCPTGAADYNAIDPYARSACHSRRSRPTSSSSRRTHSFSIATCACRFVSSGC